MTNVRFATPITQEANALGVPLAGGQLFFYTTGTEIFKDTFSDAALTIPNSNPVEADEAGRFGDIFLESGIYKVILWDVNDVPIWSADPVQGDVDPGLTLPPISGGSADFGKTIQVDDTGTGYELTSTLNRSYIIADAAGGGILKIKDEGAANVAAANPYVSFGYSSTVDGVYNEIGRVGKNNIVDGDMDITNLTSAGDINITTTGNGNINLVTGTGIVQNNGSALVHPYSMTVLTTSGTFTTAADSTINTVYKITLIGPGGGGGGCAGSTVSGGGGAGNLVVLVKNGLTASTGYTYTQAAFGTGGASGANNGSAAGNSTFVVGTSTMNGNGGGGGTAAGARGVGGAASVPTGGLTAYSLKGGAGVNGINANITFAGPGAGGINPMFSGAALAAFQTAGDAPTSYGCGGAGGAGQSATGPFAGGDGAPGVLIVERISG